jgi:hypothetical protein
LSRKDDFINLLKHFGAVEFDLDTTGFRGIAADINMEITGDFQCVVIKCPLHQYVN